MNPTNPDSPSSDHPLTLDIVVTGATGQQGGALSRVLLRNGHRVRALTRDATSKAAFLLSEAGADLRVADLDTGAGLDTALQAADAVFLVTTPFERGAQAEVIQARNLGNAAARAGIAHVVYSSVTLGMTRSPVEHFASKGEAERVLSDSGSR